MRYFKAIGDHGQETTLSAAVDIDVPAGATHILLSATTQAIRATFDGTTPTASLGIHIAAGDPPVVLPAPVTGTIKIIEEAASAVADWQFFSQAD